MPVRVGINGFGRIGRMFLRSLQASGAADLQVVAINDTAANESLAYVLQFDSLRGRYPGHVESHDGGIQIDDAFIPVFHAAVPENIHWDDAEVDVVLDSTGRFRSGSAARGHLHHGARKVLISASADGVDATLVWGVNHDRYDPRRHTVISPASCGINALSVMAKVMVEDFGLRWASTDVLLPYQGWQTIHDAPGDHVRNDPRLGRASSSNIVPHVHVAGQLLQEALPELESVLFNYDVVPTPIGGKASLMGQVSRAVSAAEVNDAMHSASEGRMKGTLDYSNAPLVSGDVAGNSASCLFDPTRTQAFGDRVRIAGWFDNEWGYANRLADLCRMLGSPSSLAA